MLTIYKYEIDLRSSQTVRMPAGGKIIHVGEQKFSQSPLCLWAMVDSGAEMKTRKIGVLGTGAENFECYSPSENIGTVICSNGFVWHVFDGGFI